MWKQVFERVFYKELKIALPSHFLCDPLSQDLELVRRQHGPQADGARAGHDPGAPCGAYGEHNIQHSTFNSDMGKQMSNLFTPGDIIFKRIYTCLNC